VQTGQSNQVKINIVFGSYIEIHCLITKLLVPGKD